MLSAQTASSPKELLQQLATAVLDKERALRLVVAALLGDGHVLLEDLPGVGKTTLALALARSLGLAFVRVQMTSDLLPGDILGGTTFDPNARQFVFRPGPIFHSVVLVDEINRASPRAQSALLEAMAEGQVSLDGQTYPLPDPFFVIATQNPMEHQGVFPLPESQLDRFSIILSLGYPSAAAEARLLAGELARVEGLAPVADAVTVQSWRQAVGQVFLSAEIRQMLLDLAHRSRSDGRIRLGLSPRGLLALRRMVQAWAFLDGRDFVEPGDLRAVTLPVLAHRLLLREPGSAAQMAVTLMQECWGFGP
ncbi:MoxR family ATPase [Acidithiobacillus caldus]|uniref:AAA family ATPase n=1 Tax=Acidithiobacillus caldus TaxID=33059 RepID=UPI001C07C4CF|nr:MoxR family ATPase [Acidithiobacillus caldus]MBU2791774.1 MoxR family ATPase [Acidithiobacillus caldus]MBU2820437.1 MoxR family ATPase [Acidithiobacillus caldus]